MKYLNETLKTIHSRKSVRNFTQEPVKTELLKELVKAAMAAPSSVNKQPWSFIVVTRRELLDQIGNGLPYAKMLLSVKAAIVVCGIPELGTGGKDSDYWVQDCCAATENLLIAAESLGLGAVWTAAFPYADRVKVVKEALDIPKNVIPLNVIPIGWPERKDQVKDKFNESKIHWEKWLSEPGFV